MHYTGPSVRWLLPGVAAAAFTDAARSKTVLDFIRETKAAGVRHFACTMAFAEHGRGEQLIDEVEGFAGAATFMAAAP